MYEYSDSAARVAGITSQLSLHVGMVYFIIFILWLGPDYRFIFRDELYIVCHVGGEGRVAIFIIMVVINARADDSFNVGMETLWRLQLVFKAIDAESSIVIYVREKRYCRK